MPRYLVKETRSYVESWLIDARDRAGAIAQAGTMIDEGKSESVAENIVVEEVPNDTEAVEL